MYVYLCAAVNVAKLLSHVYIHLGFDRGSLAYVAEILHVLVTTKSQFTTPRKFN